MGKKYSIHDISSTLIVPEGIEINNGTGLQSWFTSLIVPEGIEMLSKNTTSDADIVF